MTGNSLAIDIDRISGGGEQKAEDNVAVEEPLEIQLTAPSVEGSAAKSISVTMRTPGDDAELALGFLYSESVIRHRDELRSVDAVGPTDPDSGRRNTVRVELRPEVTVDLQRLQRHFYTTSSCGVCGKASLDALKLIGASPLGALETRFARNILIAMPDRLRERQPVFAQTGGLHAAAAFDSSGEIAVLREDVGRHNAVDKVIGWLLMQDRLPASGLGLLVSGRASFELVQKALVAGMPLLAAVGAPSSLAVRTAREFGMTLIGFLRDDRFNVYAGGARIR